MLRECIESLALTITQAAEALGVTRNTLSELVIENRGISLEMAVRLSIFGGRIGQVGKLQLLRTTSICGPCR